MAETLTIRGDLELLARAGHLFSSVREELVCAARDVGTWPRPGAREAARERMRNGGTQQVRKLFSPSALADERSRAHLKEVVAMGAQVRIAATALPHETIVIDRRYAILAGPHLPGGREYTVTTEPNLVGGVHTLFTAAWEAATDLGAFLRGEHPHLDDGGRRCCARWHRAPPTRRPPESWACPSVPTAAGSPNFWPPSTRTHASRPGCAWVSWD
ncbi:DNA-binding response regulator [Streptomyces zhihengii]